MCLHDSCLSQCAYHYTALLLLLLTLFLFWSPFVLMLKFMELAFYLIWLFLTMIFKNSHFKWSLVISPVRKKII